MSLPGLAAALLLAALVVLWIALPLLRRPDRETVAATDSASRQRERLLLYYSRVLRNIHDLDEDFATGKLDEAEYQQEREAWAQRGVAALQALDHLAQADALPHIRSQPAASRSDHSDDADNRLIDAAIAVDDDDAALDASIEAAIEAAVREQRARL